MRKGILLAGGAGTRLMPLTKFAVKQILPVYDKPMIYYPLYTLMKMGIKDILIISTPESTPILEKNLGDGSEYGCTFSYKVQDNPNGLAQAFILGKEFMKKERVCLILGDNIFYGADCEKHFREACRGNENVIFGYRVSDPERYGVVEFDDEGNALSIEEKPKKPKSSYAVPEITDVNKAYLKRKELKVKKLEVGNAYLDTGTFQSLNDASNFVRTIEERTGMKVSDIEEFSKEV